MLSKYLFLSGHEKSLTGGNKRFERLAKYAVLNKNCCFISIDRNDLNFTHDRLVFLDKPPIPTYSLRLLFACIKNRKNIINIININNIDKVIIFGETPVLAALFLCWYCKIDLSIGVRSNVPKRHALTLAHLNFFEKSKKNIRYFLNYIILKKTFNFSSSIIVQSPLAKKEFCENYNVSQEKVHFLPNDLPCITESINLKSINREYLNKPKRILFVGNDTYIKGFDVFLEFLSRDSIKELVSKVTIVGVSEKTYNTDLNILYLSRSNDVLTLMLEHDLLIVPSREDQFPNVVLEAFSVGLPVIGSDVDGISYMINNSSYLFAPGCVSSLTNLYLSLFNDGDYQKLISYIIERRKHFDFEWEEKYLTLV